MILRAQALPRNGSNLNRNGKLFRAKSNNWHLALHLSKGKLPDKFPKIFTPVFFLAGYGCDPSSSFGRRAPHHFDPSMRRRLTPHLHGQLRRHQFLDRGFFSAPRRICAVGSGTSRSSEQSQRRIASILVETSSSSRR